VAVYKRGSVWWYPFTWDGKPFRESTKQTNKRVAEKIEAACKTSLAKGEFGIRDRKPAQTMKEFVERDFMPYTESRFQNKPRTLEYYKNGVKNILAFPPLATCRLDAVTQGLITAFLAKKRDAKLQVTSINRQLEVLRRILKLAAEWNKVDKCVLKGEKLQSERGAIASSARMKRLGTLNPPPKSEKEFLRRIGGPGRHSCDLPRRTADQA
jgi:hypothetical protein